MKTKQSISRVEEAYSKRSMSSSSTCSTLKSVKDEHWDGVNQVKMENQLVVGVKSEKPESEPTVNNTKFENMDIWTLNEEFDIKNEYENAVSDRIKVEEKLESGLEAHSTADTVNQMKMEFQESEKLEEKPDLRSTNLENMDALGLHHEFDIKTESDQDDRHDSASDSVQIKIKREKEQRNPPIEEGKQSFSCYICNYTSHCKKGLIGHIKRNNCYLRSNLGKSRSVSRKQYLYRCIKCRKVFKSKTSLDNHLVKKHVGSIALVPSKIHECTFCDFKTAYKRPLNSHMLKHTTKLRICKHCNTSFKTERSLFGHISKRHPNFSGTVSSKIYECMHCPHKQIARSNFIRHLARHDTRTTFKCNNCDASFNTKRRLENHVIQKHPKFESSVSCKIHKCTHCEYKTIYKDYLVSHMMKHTGAKLKCTKCDKSFTTIRTLDDHILRKHPEFTTSVSRKIHRCTHCEYKTIYKGHLVSHMMKHTGAKLKCTKCDKSFTATLSLDDHILREHPDVAASVSRKIHKCTHCEYKTIYKEYLVSHMMKHTGSKLKCTKCDASFTTIRPLDNHIWRKHPEFTTSVSRKLHKCTHCEYKTTYKGYLVSHMMKHTGAKHKCTKCNASFTTTLALDEHILRKHPEFTTSVSRKIHKCTHCEYKTTFQHCLPRHMMKHTGAKLKCTKCDASFTTTLSLDDHILRTHPDFTTSVSRKIHKCTHCEYKTTYKGYLVSHMMKHTGAKHKCTKCNASFTTTLALDEHILRKHPEFTTSVSRKIHKCTHCEYKTTYKGYLVSHMMKHTGAKHKCTKCNASYTTTLALDEHILRKHPEFTTSVSRKIHKCTHCEYKTTYKKYLVSHMMKHTGAKHKCTKCNASFTTTLSLDDHILRTHPEFTTSVSRKLHKCTHCEYKTTYKGCLVSHMMKHAGAKHKCTKCNASFTTTLALDEHILRKHPEFTTSVSRKIHKCTHCEYKTTYKKYLVSHMMKHTGAKHKCTKCNASFTTTLALDEHILRKHPEFTTSVSRKIHKCTHCEYKTTFQHCLPRHMMKHTGAKLKCTKCDASFTTTLSLDDHILRTHPDFTTTFARKEYLDNRTFGKQPELIASGGKLKKSLDRTNFNMSNYDNYECCNVTFDCKSTFDDHVIKIMQISFDEL
ncbi:unnamed protein product [Acanthoscelides obtectus]|uniref:C2H2-type domain-containing protein n=1 Tax=Acanthoscelides obtectus TaxID=200917 RepID=A0A9P0QC56_ACAOB|nr:unnamed protein product [Acanthoscelides obtectus]CAK1670556.1 hypothetical protein AOBTE_LOCUS27672 [Acanthoscelides obtectus]